MKTDVGRRISGVATLYTDADIRAAANSDPDRLVLWTKKCRLDVGAMPWDTSDVLQLLDDCLNSGQRHRPEWCWAEPDGPVAACDVFTVLRTETHPMTQKPMVMKYYLKIAITVAGTNLLVVSCHHSDR